MPRAWSARASPGSAASSSIRPSMPRSGGALGVSFTHCSSKPQCRTRRLSVTNATSRIDDIVKQNDIVLFMKGTALFPQCGFSSRAIAILDRLGAKYETVDVLQDQEIRAGIKDYSEWPTIPQLYVKGEFVGGSDIMMEMFESGELQQLLGEPSPMGEGGRTQ